MKRYTGIKELRNSLTTAAGHDILFFLNLKASVGDLGT